MNLEPLSHRELRMNQQAATIAASVLSEAVEAATRCEQLTSDMKAQTLGMEGTQALFRATKALLGGRSVRR
jgi:hypothetical protein